MSESKDITTALYTQLLNHLREQIVSGQYPSGSRLPSESELIASFGISRGPIRQAMGILENEGLIERVKGSGTFVRDMRPKIINGNGADRHIGLVLSQQGDQLNMEILIGAEQAAKSRGYRVSFSYSEEDPEQQRRDIQRMKDDGIKGLIVFPVGEDAEREGIARVVKSGEIPIVLVDRYFPDLDTDYVVADNYTGGYRATEHLLILGHRRIGFVYTHASTLNITSLNQRYSGYRNAIESYGLDYDDSLVVQRTAHGGYEDFLSRRARPDAVFAASDLEALLILRAAHKHHIRVPDDLALVGFDDLTFAHLSNPPLTTVAQPRNDIGLRASNLLIDRLEHLRATTKQIVLPTNLIVRESCGAKTQVKRSIAGD